MRLNVTNNKQKGFTLIELLGVLAAIGILGTIAVNKILGKTDDNKVNTMMDEMNIIVLKMVDCGETNGGDFTECDMDYLEDNGKIDDNLVDGNPFGGDYTAGVVAGNTNRFFVASDSIPKAEWGADLIEKYREQTAIVPVFDDGTGTITTTWGIR